MAMHTLNVLSKTRNFWWNIVELQKVVHQRSNISVSIHRSYAKDSGGDGCRRALVDIPPDVDPNCPIPCERHRPKKKGILHRIKLRMIEGGTNFGTPFRFLKPDEASEEKDDKEDEKTAKDGKEKEEEKPKAKVKEVPLPRQREGLQVSILGADTPVGQYVALQLKQCPCIKKLRLYEAKDSQCCSCGRPLGNVVHDLHHIDTNCRVQAFSCACCELERCLQNTDIVLMLESGYLNIDMPFVKRFQYQAPIVKHYADCIAAECPKAFVIVCATPIDCMVPLISETMKETGWYDPRKILGSLAVPEMRSSTLAARALCLEPRYTRVPCVGGTEGEALVPLFSKAVEYFDFAEHNAMLMTDAVRHAPVAVARSDGPCLKAADLSEAHALAGLVIKVAHALLCHDVPRLTGFVESDETHVISPARYLASEVLLNDKGICKKFDIPGQLNTVEVELLDAAIPQLVHNVCLANTWYASLMQQECSRSTACAQTFFGRNRIYDRIHDCNDKLLNKLEENEPELATSPEEECVICVNAKATMQTSPCGHRVVCRRCFVKTIQMAVSQRLLPLRCVICRAKILRLRQAPRLVTSKSWQVSSSSGKSWGVPGSVSSYSVGARSVPASASLYSVTSGESSLSGVSSVSSNSGGNVPSTCSTKLCGGAKCGGACLGAVPRSAPASLPPQPRQPASNALRRSQHHSMKARLQEYRVMSYTGGPGEPSTGRLPPIREFQREFREGRRDTGPASATASVSTRIRCAQKIVTQLETSPQKQTSHFFRPLKSSNKDESKSREHSIETERKNDNPKTKTKKEDKKKKEDESDDKNKKDESSDNRKNELAEKKKEEKLRLKAEKEAKKEAKQLAKEEERQAKLLAKEEERQAKLLAKEEKKKAKKEAKLAAQAEKEKNK